MYLNINILSIILTLQCLKIFAAPVEGGQNHCKIQIPSESTYMPLPIYVSRLKGSIKVLYPNQDGTLIVKDEQNLILTCAGANFITPFFYNGDVVVKCINGSLTNRGRLHNFNSYKCRTNPKPRMMTTQNICQKVTNRIVEVGFETYYGFKKQYKICYNTHTRNALYSWYFVRTPINQFRQTLFTTPNFINAYFTGKINVMKMYDNQTNRIEQQLGSKELAEKYINMKDGSKRYLAPDHLIPPNDFIYSSEKYSTYFYENTVPQWLSFSEDIWSEVEELFLRNVNDTAFKTHLIVSGAYLPTLLPDKYGKERVIHLVDPDIMSVPQYLWKLDYNIESRVGVVYIAMTNPYLTLNETGYICDTMPCPNVQQLSDKARNVVYCCSKTSFETMYRVLDPAVYQRF